MIRLFNECAYSALGDLHNVLRPFIDVETVLTKEKNFESISMRLDGSVFQEFGINHAQHRLCLIVGDKNISTHTQT